MANPKFSFTEEKLLIGGNKAAMSERHAVTISLKYGSISFSNPYIVDKNLDGKYIKFYADPAKNAIAWKIIDEKHVPQLGGYRQLRAQVIKKQGKYDSKVYKLTILKLLGIMGFAKDQPTFLNLPIKKYVGQGMLEDNLEYVELIKPVSKDNEN